MRRKRILSLLLMAALVLALLPVAATPAQAASEPDFIVDVTQGDITIREAGANVLEVVYGWWPQTTASVLITQEITVIGSTMGQSVTVESGGTAEKPIKIRLNGVTINLLSGAGCAAFAIESGAAVNLTLAGNNSLSSGSNHAGLQVPSGATLTIGGTGELTAAGCDDAAGIGGGYDQSGGNITIEGGTVIATGAGGGAGIGGCFSGEGGEITISGGTVTATGGVNGAGIGGGQFGDGGSVYISGGSVRAVAGVGAQAIGHGSMGASSGTLSNGTDNGNQAVSLTEAEIPGTSSGTKVIDLTIPSAAYYGTKDLYTDAEGKLYLWLPEGGMEGARVKTADKAYDWNSSANKFEADTALPIVTGVLPSGTNMPISGSLALTFSEEMRTEGAVSLDGGATSLPGGSWNDAKTVYTVPYSGLAYNTEYIVTISGFMDYSGNEMALDASYSFTTVARSSGGGGGSSGERSSTQPDYQADVSGGGTLPVTINSSARNASVNINEQLGSSIMNGSHEIITMPSIPGISSYTLGIPVAYLTTPGGGTLTFRTGAGSITLPADMMAGIPGAEGKKAAITIGVGDKSALPQEIKDAIGDRPLIEISLTLDGEPASWNNPNAQVTISIPYEPTAEELAHPESIVIWYIDGNGNAVCVPNGHYDPDTGTVTFTTTHFSLYAVAYNLVSFSDVPAGAWYAGAVSFIAARDITRGTGDGRFSPAANLTRTEFIVLLMKAYGIAPDTNPNDNFSDAGNTWYTNYLAAAKRLGITSGIGNNQYAPGKEITRQEMFTLLCNTLKVIGQLPAGNSGRLLSDFSDSGDIASWAKDSLALLVQTGIVSGSGGRLNPSGLTTRAEMAQVLYNLLGE